MPTPYARASQAAPPSDCSRVPRTLGSALAVTVLVAVTTFLAFAGIAVGQGSTFRVALEPPAQLDPAFASSDAEIAVLNAVYDYLVDVDGDNEIVPRLARSWNVSDDGLTYTFELAEGVSFHDGTPLRAEDVVWTFDRLRDPELELPTSDLYAIIESIEATDDLEVRFTLREVNPFFLYDLSDNHAVVLREGTSDAATAFNGTGPFRVEEYRTGTRMSLSANPEYFMPGKPGVDELELIFFRDQVAAIDALRGRQVDLVLRMPTPLFQSLQGTPGLEAVSVATNAFDLVRLRADRGPGADVRVQQALKLATDRDAIVQVVTFGLAAPGKDSPIGPLYGEYFADDLELPPHDPERARELLTEAGYADGLTLELHTPDTGDRPTLAVVLADQWAQAGITVDVIVHPESVYYGDNLWLEVDLGITGWGSRPVPQFYLDVMLACDAVWNEAHWCDPEFDELVRFTRTTLDEAARVEAYHEMQRILVERGPIIIPYFFPQYGVIADTFDGFELKAFPGRSDLAAIHPR
ncbi:MAG: ABC transporter substrate-binding protein [Trueperaceae bacterium]|nr:ABC transporter substrate-binding protein [Trueperaceae bacterium]